MQAAPLFTTLMEQALQLIRSCGCKPDTGCPGCVQHVECGEYNAVISKVLTASRIHGPCAFDLHSGSRTHDEAGSTWQLIHEEMRSALQGRRLG